MSSFSVIVQTMDADSSLRSSPRIKLQIQPKTQGTRFDSFDSDLFSMSIIDRKLKITENEIKFATSKAKSYKV